MKLILQNGQATIQSESRVDLERMLNFMNEQYMTITPKKRTHRPHKPNVPRSCEYCGKPFKGLQGVRIHQVKCPKKIQVDTFNLGAVMRTYEG